MTLLYDIMLVKEIRLTLTRTIININILSFCLSIKYKSYLEIFEGPTFPKSERQQLSHKEEGQLLF